MRVLTSLYVSDHRARVSVSKGTLLVTNGDRSRLRVPIEALEAVVLLGHAQVTNDALAECVRHHVRVSSLSRGGRVRFVVGGPISGNVHLRVAQVRAFDDPVRRAAICRSLVAGKLQNCRRLLRRWAWDSQPLPRWHLERLAESIGERITRVRATADEDRLRGLEGDGTRLYFQGLGHHLDEVGVSMPFTARNRRPPRDPVNALLSFLYGLVTAEIVGAVDGIGLDPQVGYLHGLRPGRPSLALDLLEELRAVIADRLAVRLLSRRSLGPSGFVRMGGGACYLTDEARRQVLDAYETYKTEEVQHLLLGRSVTRGAIPSIQAVLMARHLRGDLAAYPPFVIAE
ncbi:MAG: CRISPR-associated endonuclease Cas1 [Acidimicrobiales bacterium]